jgi:hypothetical protein
VLVERTAASEERNASEERKMRTVQYGSACPNLGPRWKSLLLLPAQFTGFIVCADMRVTNSGFSPRYFLGVPQ